MSSCLLGEMRKRHDHKNGRRVVVSVVVRNNNNLHSAAKPKNGNNTKPPRLVDQKRFNTSRIVKAYIHIIYPVEEEEGNYSRCSRETLLMAYDLAGNSIQLDITLGENSGEISDTCVSLVRGPRIRLRGHPVNGLSLFKKKIK